LFYDHIGKVGVNLIFLYVVRPAPGKSLLEPQKGHRTVDSGQWTVLICGSGCRVHSRMLSIVRFRLCLTACA